MNHNAPKAGTFTRTLFELIRGRPGVTTKELVEATGGRHTSGNMSYVNTCLNAIRRRGLVENRTGPRRMGHWYLTAVGEEQT